MNPELLAAYKKIIELSMYRHGKVVHCVNCHGYDGKHLGNCITEKAEKYVEEHK